MAEPELVREIIPRVLALFIRKCGHTTRLIWPKTCENCDGNGHLDDRICPVCDGLGYLK